MKRNKAHDFRVKFDAILVVFIIIFGWSMLAFLGWFAIALHKHNEQIVLKFAPWYIGISLSVLMIGNLISSIATYFANKHFEKYNWAQ